MPRISFTPFKLETLAPPPAKPCGTVVQVDYFDETTPGFGLRVSSNNVRSWVLHTRLNGKSRRYTIGRAPREKGAPGITLAQARAEAVRLRDAVKAGRDPLAEAAEKQKEKLESERQDHLAAERNLFRSVVTAYIDGYAKKETRRWKDTERILNKYCAPAWGAKSVYAITRQDVAELLDGIQENSGP
jgi:hypothetical protein